jgi:DNA-binding NtrC family response regulator
MTDCTVLLVDDEVDFVEALADRLEARGLQVVKSNDGRSALNAAEERTFDAIVLDMAMPGMDGIETLENLLKINPDLQVILLTGRATLNTGTSGDSHPNRGPGSPGKAC